MGTLLTVGLACPHSDNCNEDFAVISDILARIDRAMSIYHASEITHLNDAAGSQAFLVPVGTDSESVLSASLKIAQETQGYFDPTVLPLLRLHGLMREDFGADVHAPSAEQVKVALDAIGFRDLWVRGGHAGLRRKSMAVDLGGIAKGYTLDTIAKALVSRGINQFSLNFGGHLYVQGLTEHTRSVDPANSALTLAECTIAHGSLSVSAQDKRFVHTRGGKRGHLINPRSGRPETDGVLSLVYDVNAMRADAWSTAVFFMPEADFYALTHRHRIAAMKVVRGRKPWVSNQMRQHNICRFARP
jgi:FAD:protein FMN transferase